ncbi:hypothetical protein FHT87_005880 [Rhizobium sp. BK316]|nr:hypothetical protein [Rhizobium sp. BK316]
MGGTSIGDPIVKAIQCGIISVCLSDPATGASLSRLELRQNAGIAEAVQVDAGVLYYCRERVKSLTVTGLKEALMAAIKSEQWA